VSGRLDGRHQFLLDNRSYQGRPGYEVLTPLTRAAGAVLLIDRGWVPFTGSRARLPDVGLTGVAGVTVSGRVAELPSAGLASGRAAPDPRDPWPKVTSFPSAQELAGVLGVPLTQRILLLDPGAPEGYVRDWQPPGLAPLRHLSYALQWWCFAALAVVVWAVMSVRRSRAVRGRS
jgi:surfeit locus 1 family protein